ncbi:hypothetical protein KDJ21_025895 [Metabacillus litoralis]|uniref:hypothetical protein n=1 Tax=Metabacillus litoralis TaxID=152268 RepID=UPI001B9E0046|nr:hypothetical protein [Metabacillus litoralis]UHA60102.1 hypothetical protein KDJ21_025895 [Metabacillus litoralis]
MKKIAKQLLTLFKNNEGKNFDATLHDNMEDKAGFSFMSFIKAGEVHFRNDRISVSEPLTGRYFCLPFTGIKEIVDESTGEYDIAFTVRYKNYNVYIQIFEAW